MKLGNTAQSPEVGNLVLKHLCPAIYALVQDGLNPHVRSLFGKMKNSVWRVVEASAEAGESGARITLKANEWNLGTN